MCRHILPIFLLLFVVQAFSDERWPLWDKHDASNQQSIRHDQWQLFLDNYVSYSEKQGFNLVNYKAVTKKDKSLLSDYIKSLSAIDPRIYNRDQQMAYWINLYNAKTVELILDNYPVSSIRKLGEGFLSFGPWKDKLLSVANTPLSLDDIEHRILRPIWQDRRIHYAVNCASIGCPELSNRAFTADNLQKLLDQGERAYINHPRGVTFSNGRLLVSKIFDWYQSDFADSEQALLKYFSTYSNSEQADKLDSYQGRIRYEYDWSLNEL